MPEENVLLILAAGKSSRFGGFPKAFCRFGDEYLAQRTVKMASESYDKIFLVLNDAVFHEYKDAVYGCKTLHIPTGQGDAHSFLRALRLIKAECACQKITLCWGDTFYLNRRVFEKTAEITGKIDDNCAGASLCSIDPEPYAWFDVEGNIIKKSSFKASDGVVKTGIHDQSVFVFNTDIIMHQLQEYMKYLGIDDNSDFINSSVSREMKLLHSFTWFYSNKLKPMCWDIIDAGLSVSFNTAEELENIRNNLN